jgi:uncharacterized protein
MKNLSVVIDTNVFLVIIPSRSRYHWVFEALKRNQFTLLLSSEIVSEYEEQMKFRYQVNVADQLLDILLLKKNVRQINPSYHWNLIASDADDNKFVDCAIAGNADSIVTHDTDFDVLKQLPFPKVNVLSLEEFAAVLKDSLQTG